jgi:hypothetical protein
MSEKKTGLGEAIVVYVGGVAMLVFEIPMILAGKVIEFLNRWEV